MADEHGGLAGLFDQITALLHRTPTAPPAPPAQLEAPVVQRNLAAAPFPNTPEPSPRRYQEEIYAVHLVGTGATATIRATVRPAFWCVYLKGSGTAGDGVWVRSGEVPPSAPLLATGVIQAVPHWLSGTATLVIHAPEMTLAMTFVGTGPLDVIAVACTGVEVPHR